MTAEFVLGIWIGLLVGAWAGHLDGFDHGQREARKGSK